METTPLLGFKRAKASYIRLTYFALISIFCLSSPFIPLGASLSASWFRWELSPISEILLYALPDMVADRLWGHLDIIFDCVTFVLVADAIAKRDATVDGSSQKDDSKGGKLDVGTIRKSDSMSAILRAGLKFVSISITVMQALPVRPAMIMVVVAGGTYYLANKYLLYRLASITQKHKRSRDDASESNKNKDVTQMRYMAAMAGQYIIQQAVDLFVCIPAVTIVMMIRQASKEVLVMRMFEKFISMNAANSKFIQRSPKAFPLVRAMWKKGVFSTFKKAALYACVIPPKGTLVAVYQEEDPEHRLHVSVVDSQQHGTLEDSGYNIDLEQNNTTTHCNLPGSSYIRVQS